jgi:pantoate--beta-alanine ligase
METVRDPEALRARVRAWRASGETVGLVPTMGGIHDGHLALVRAARAASAHVVASLFVNPAQFGPAEDFAGYPRDEDRDAALIEAAGGELLYAPTVETMYPDGFQTTVSVAKVTKGLCGDHRPGHFDGVATVVTKLFAQCEPDAAWFGEKDYQQLTVIRRLTHDLGLAVAVHGVATVREADGLALSSRNAYLDARERAIAPILNRSLAALAEAVAGGAALAEETVRAREALLDAGFASVDYVELRDAQTLAPIDAVTRPARVLAAARLDRARLIDNVAVEPPDQER